MNYTQQDRAMAVTTPLGPDKLLLLSFTGQEAISRLFDFQLDLTAENEVDVAFDKLLGQKITTRLDLPDGEKRYFSGICNRVGQGERDEIFTRYRMEVVPQFWLLTKRAQSRIFQQMTVPDILKKVLTGLDVTYEIQGSFHPRDFCVQYRETDFNFASRLMEEEGFFYFFKHNSEGHQMVVANTPQSHPDLPTQSKIIYEEVQEGNREEDRIYDWEKMQEWRSGKYVLWDHCFELPHKHLEAEANILDAVQVGKVSHKFKVGGNDKLEIYDYPGEYAQRFDGIQPGGGDRAADLQKIFQDNRRTTDIRIQEEALPGLTIQGGSNCRQFVSGYKFTLQRHFNADGDYVITNVNHSARQAGDYRSNGGDFDYSNSFKCIPAALPFRPQRLTPKPVVQGTQTAVVVGPAGEEIFTDKYGRIKVQFHWDRQGKNDANSSCWVRVGTPLAGKQWGMVHIPRIEQEVIVDFLEGDPDQPLIVGRVYNAELMPPYALPANGTQTGTKSRSSKSGSPSNFNELRFEDKKGSEQIFVQGEKDLDIIVKNDRRESIGANRHLTVGADRIENVGGNQHLNVKADRVEQIGGDQHLTLTGDLSEKVGKGHSLDVGTDLLAKAGTNLNGEAGQAIYLKAGMNVVIEAGVQLTIKAAGGFVSIDPSGVTIQGTLVKINSGGSAGSGSAKSLKAPKAPSEPKKAVDKA
jgi:type VI secretion system secreted protein VgrG